ncbi:hypothetical protein [Methanococcoides sp. FTZ1]|uniref:hypothetical protein n=1 Tax=Methanococcoides sp. FTZ1 TaxID=3439061 RepID=UPI003F851A31
MLEGWIENCPWHNRDIELLECMKCEHFTKIDCIFIVCGYKERYSKRRKTYRDSETNEEAIRCDLS